MILMLIVTLLISTPSLRAAEKSLQISKIPGSHDGKVVQADGAGLGRRWSPDGDGLGPWRSLKGSRQALQWKGPLHWPIILWKNHALYMNMYTCMQTYHALNIHAVSAHTYAHTSAHVPAHTSTRLTVCPPKTPAHKHVHVHPPEQNTRTHSPYRF